MHINKFWIALSLIFTPCFASAETIKLKCKPQSFSSSGTDTNGSPIINIYGDLVWEYKIITDTMDYCVTSYRPNGTERVEAGCFGANSVKKIDKKQIIIAEKEKDDLFSFEQYVNHKWQINRKTLISTQTIDYLAWDETKKGKVVYVQKCVAIK